MSAPHLEKQTAAADRNRSRGVHQNIPRDASRLAAGQESRSFLKELTRFKESKGAA